MLMQRKQRIIVAKVMVIQKRQIRVAEVIVQCSKIVENFSEAVIGYVMCVSKMRLK